MGCWKVYSWAGDAAFLGYANLLKNRTKQNQQTTKTQIWTHDSGG